MDLEVAYYYMSRVGWTTAIMMIGAFALYMLDEYGILQKYCKRGGRYIYIYGLVFYFINLFYCTIKAFIYYI